MTDTPRLEPAVAVRDCRLVLGRSGATPVTFSLAALDVAPGERVALTGPSGCGKSTLLNLLCGLVQADAGSVRVSGTELRGMRTTALDAFRGRTFGFVYQTFNLLEAFTTLENVQIGMRFGRGVPHGERRTRALALLDRVGLSHRLHSRPARLSVGERQRVAIARALANHPPILLADEPTGALDPATAERVFELLLDICTEQKCTLLLVTHDHDLAARLPRRVDCRDLVALNVARPEAVA
ncbi:MAG: ABC transporter ATP-binding protein [Candidatus Sumerlaeia bacterium]|nr:ABC transporter ATP-binding protein [Candidatus Sumerlaeia bacterium]